MTNLNSIWKFLGDVGLNPFYDYGDRIIITDAENFPKYFDPRRYYMLMDKKDYEKTKDIRLKIYPQMKDLRTIEGIDTKYLENDGTINLLEHEEYLEIGEYNSYNVPWRNNSNIRASLWGRFIDNNIINVLIYHTEPKNLDDKTDFALNITNKCYLNIYSGYIGIDEPIGFKENELLESEYKFKCPQGSKKIEVSEININYSNFNNDKILLGTIVNLDKNHNLNNGEVKDLMKKIKNEKDSK